MNVFVIGWSTSGDIDVGIARTALTDAGLLSAKLGGGRPESWTSADGCVVVATMSHGLDEVPHVRYTHFEEHRMSLFAGRPFVWTNDRAADGVAPLDARFFLDRDLSAGEIDGRFTAARYDAGAGVLEILTDRLGAYPVFVAEGHTATWIGNAPYIVSRASATTELDVVSLGHFLTFGWALGGTSLWHGVTRIPRGTLETRTRNGRRSAKALLPSTAICNGFGGSPDMADAAPLLTATVGALGAWPGRPNVVPVTGGRDSRVVFAAAVAADLEFTARTIAFPGAAGYPNTPDVVVSREVVEALDRTRHVHEPPKASGVRRSAKLMRQASHGLVSLGETGLVGDCSDGVALEVIHSGHGGELSRSRFFAGDAPSERDLVTLIVGRWSHRWPPPITNEGAREASRGYVQGWVRRHLEIGFAPSDIPDAFLLLELMPYWAAPPQSLQELSNDTTAPLWSPRMLPFTFAGSARDRLSEWLHFELLQALASPLARIPFEGLNPVWPTFPHSAHRARRHRTLIFKVRREIRRRTSARIVRSGAFNPLLLEARREAFLGLSALDNHVVWEVLDRRRTHRLLTRDPRTLDPRSQRMIWRLASVIAAEIPDDA